MQTLTTPSLQAERHYARFDARDAEVADPKAHYAAQFEQAVKAGDAQAKLHAPSFHNPGRLETLADTITSYANGEKIAALLLRLRAEGDFDATAILLEVQECYADTSAEVVA